MFLFQYLLKIYRDEPLGVFFFFFFLVGGGGGGGGGGGWRWWGHSPRMRSGGSGDEGSLPNSFGCEFVLFIKTHFYWGGGWGWRVGVGVGVGWGLGWGGEGGGGGALTSHLMEEHSSPTSIFPVFMMTSSNGNMFHVTGFCAGNSPVTAGNSPVTVEFPSHRQWHGALMFSLIYAWTNGWVNNQDAGDLRRHRAHYDITVMWCRIVIQWSGQPRDLSAFNTSLLSNF